MFLTPVAPRLSTQSVLLSSIRYFPTSPGLTSDGVSRAVLLSFAYCLPLYSRLVLYFAPRLQEAFDVRMPKFNER